MRCLVIVPAYNEEDSVAAVVDTIRTTQPTLDVLVVDDGSSDSTRAKALAGDAAWAMRLLARSLSRTCGTTLTDVTSGFRAVNRTAIELFAAHYRRNISATPSSRW